MRSRRNTLAAALLLTIGLASAAPAQVRNRLAQAADSANVPAEPTEVLGTVNVTQSTDFAVDARDALRRRDGVRLLALRDLAATQRHPLASWIDYWELFNRLNTAQQGELDAFYARWPQTYVEDRLRNDWLLELGKRRDWANFAREFPRFRMNDDREVSCYALLVEQQNAPHAGKASAGLKIRAFEAWVAQRDLDDGCNLMATAFYDAKVFSNDDAWQRARLAAEAGRLRVVRAAAALAAPTLQTQVANAVDKPALYLNAGATVGTRANSEITALAIARVAANDPNVAAAQLRERWDAIVLDSYGAGWALNRCLAFRAASGDRRPILVHVSHNHEEALWRSMARETRGSALRRLALWQNFRKVCALERRIVRNVDLLTTITDEDRRALGARLGEGHTLTLTPGYTGWVANGRVISTDTPRRVIIVGSFHWVVKQENLRRFVELADPAFSQHGIELDIIGDIPSDLLAELKSRCRATHFHGFVADIAPILAQARMAVVPEPIGGGFKLKFLDYIFGRVPVATVSQAAAGLPPEIRRNTLECADLPGLVRDIVWQIDRIDELNCMQERAFTYAKTQFRWEHRGQQLRRAISRLTSPENVEPGWAK